MKLKLELVPIPVSDVDRALAFYVDALGFTKDVDVQPADGVRVVQVTPEGSGCSIGFGTGLDVYRGEPGSVRGLHLVVEDLDATRAELVGRGVVVVDHGQPRSRRQGTAHRRCECAHRQVGPLHRATVPARRRGTRCFSSVD